jgi:hypothetical protein
LLPNECIICAKHRGDFSVPGGALYQDELLYASHAHLGEGMDTVYLGWLVVETHRHIPGLAEMNDDEARAHVLGRSKDKPHGNQSRESRCPVRRAAVA